jgi:flavin-dependent thymidylate synthase
MPDSLKDSAKAQIDTAKEFVRAMNAPYPPKKDLVAWADRAQYVSEPATSNAPVVTLLSATADPLGEIASLCGIYEGRVVHSLSDVTDEQRRTALADMQLSKLSGPLEAVQFHFLIENVTRAWTHQAVRNRFAFFAQESMRFAVVEDWADRMPIPISIQTDSRQLIWEQAVDAASEAYMALVNSGVPAEDARALMPHGITTRLHMVVSLRSLLTEAGKRLCTQAQFEWRVVVAGMVNAIRQRECSWDTWQFDEISDILRPVCYAEGKCGFMASMDRGCTIRERVDANAKIGRPSSEWDKEADLGTADEWRPGVPEVPWFRKGPYEGSVRLIIPAISNAEWAADPAAARVAPGTEK